MGVGGRLYSESETRLYASNVHLTGVFSNFVKIRQKVNLIFTSPEWFQ